MSKRRNFSVVLHDNAAADLRGVLSPWLKSNDLVGAYVNCKSTEPNGPYFHMLVEFPGDPEEFEIQIPHASVKAVICTVDLKKLGFV